MFQYGKLARGLAALCSLLILGALALSSVLPAFGTATNVLAVGGGTIEYYADFQNADGQTQSVKVLLHLPAGNLGRQPLPVLVALHGYGGNGEQFSSPLLEAADRLGWAVVAPTIAYRDWRDPAAVCLDARDDLPGLRAVLDDLPQRTGLRFESRVLLYGFSRGAQYAHRFALAYPEKVAAVAAMSAGTYTLPQTTWRDPDGTETTLNMPYGVADLSNYTGRQFRIEPLRQVTFWVAVGSSDQQQTDVPRHWDKYIGDCRVDRATSFVDSLAREKVPVTLQEFANTAHTETDEMRGAALQFLATRAAGLAATR